MRIGIPDSAFLLRSLAFLTALMFVSGCLEEEEDIEDGGLLDAKIFNVDMQVDSWDTSDPESPQYSSVASMLYGTFPIDPEAVTYTAVHVNPESPALDSEGTWEAGERIPEVFAIPQGIVAGYDENGIVGGEYFLRVTGGGCQSGADGACQPGTESTLATESLLRDVRTYSTLTITISYE